MSASDQQNKDIIAEQAASLDAKSDYTQADKFQTRSTVLSDDSNVNEDAVKDFPGASVATGRTGQTGGGTNSQLIPPEEGGEGRAGTQSAIYEDPRGNKEDIKADIHRNDPSVNRSDSDNVRKESGIAGARPPQELEKDQEGAARSFT